MERRVRTPLQRLRNEPRDGLGWLQQIIDRQYVVVPFVNIAWSVPHEASALVVVHLGSAQSRRGCVAQTLEHQAPVLPENIVHASVDAHAQRAAVNAIHVYAEVLKEQSLAGLRLQRQKALVQSMHDAHNNRDLPNGVGTLQLRRLGRHSAAGGRQPQHVGLCKVENPVGAVVVNLLAAQRTDFLQASSRQRLQRNDYAVIWRQGPVIEDIREEIPQLPLAKRTAGSAALSCIAFARSPLDKRPLGCLGKVPGTKQRGAVRQLVMYGFHAIAARPQVLCIELDVVRFQGKHALPAQQGLQVQGDDAIFFKGLEISLTATNAAPMLKALHRRRSAQRLQQKPALGRRGGIRNADIPAQDADPGVQGLTAGSVDDVCKGTSVLRALKAPCKRVPLFSGSQDDPSSIFEAATRLFPNLLARLLQLCHDDCDIRIGQATKRSLNLP